MYNLSEQNVKDFLSPYIAFKNVALYFEKNSVYLQKIIRIWLKMMA